MSSKSDRIQIRNLPLRITVFRNAYSLLWGLILFASACSGEPAAVAPSPTSPGSPSVNSAPSQAAPVTPETAAAISPSATAAPAPQLCSPLGVQPLDKLKEIVTQPFSMPRILDDGTYKDDAHHGVDLGYYTRDGQKFTGTPVLAALGGKIAAVIHDRPPYGNMVILETPFPLIPPRTIAQEQIASGDSLYTLYAHMQNLQPLKIGQEVHCGQQLAETGLTGFTGGPHLHFETRWGPANQIFQGMGYYRADMTPEEMSNYSLWRMSGTFHLFDPLDLLAP